MIVPTYRESTESIHSMIKHFELISFPRDRLRLYICDDSPDPVRKIEIEEMCKSAGNVSYVARSGRRGYKAGAINDVLAILESEYVICLDVDHLPNRNLVERLVGEIKKTENDFLMFPQYFRNEGENNVSMTTALMQKVDYLFDRLGQCTTNSAFCVTTNWIARSDALRGIGGLDETTITEDLATGIVAHAHGLKIGIIKDALASGLTPNKLDSWRKQQYRWAYGTFHVARTVLKRDWRSLSLSQLFDYSQCISWYLVGPFTFMMYLFPILSMLGFGFLAITSPQLFVFATAAIIAFGWLSSNFGRPQNLQVLSACGIEACHGIIRQRSLCQGPTRQPS